jgi:hypothetical protein
LQTRDGFVVEYVRPSDECGVHRHLVVDAFLRDIFPCLFGSHNGPAFCVVRSDRSLVSHLFIIDYFLKFDLIVE